MYIELTFYRIWTKVLAVIAFGSVILSPIYMGFLNNVYALSAVDMVLNAIFLIDWALQFFLADEDMVTNSQIARNNHHERNWLVIVIDFVSSLPEQVFLLILGDTAYIVLIILRLWRLKKVYECISE